MATLVHYFPFISGAQTDVAGDISLTKQGDGAIYHTVLAGELSTLHFEADDTRLNFSSVAAIQGDWCVTFRLRLGSAATDQYPYPISFPSILFWAEKFTVSGNKVIRFSINYYGGDGNTNTEGFDATELTLTLPEGVDYHEQDMLVVMNCSAAEGLRLYVNNQAALFGGFDSNAVAPWLNLDQSQVGANAYPAWPPYIGAGRESWEGGNVYIGDFAILQGTLTEQERGDLWNSGEGFPILSCTLSTVTEETLDSGVYWTLCPDNVPEFDDWAADIDPITAQEYWALEIDDGILDAIRIPISSWQGTSQLERASYAQAVIPGALQWVDAVNERADGNLIVYRGVRHPDGTTQEVEMARAPIDQVQLDQGPINATMTLSGYRTQAAPAPIPTRYLQNVRSQSTAASGVRFRSDIDWFLRPGHEASARGTTFEVAYINYYVTRGQAYMDAGERIAVAQPSPVLVLLPVGQSVADGRAMELIVGSSVTMTAGQSVAAGRVLVPDTGA